MTVGSTPGAADTGGAEGGGRERGGVGGGAGGAGIGKGVWGGGGTDGSLCKTNVKKGKGGMARSGYQQKEKLGEGGKHWTTIRN